ncbi:RNA polymerase sigma factor [Sphingobacterium sp. SYP-B4668]|uniref:RNA polymerase sigma factor n=1 Tax=Sphingobacterium sp. SYP-B4668 TaxID=2996035 RepID=UPI0022DE1CCE|nr:sigma-70 family RNA polymerase sigma factor [Sphingobacterium sp. SYP-B4668]
MNQGFPKILQEDFVRFKSGDQIEFRKIFNIYYKLIYRYSLRFLKQHEDTEELVQEVFILLYLNREKIEDAAAVYPYLFTITKRLVISSFRKKIIESKFEVHLQNIWKEEDYDTEESLASRELSYFLDRAIASLPEKQKEVYAMNKLEGLSYQEIADKIGISKNTVKNHLITASKTVKVIMRGIYLIFFLMKI